MTSLQGKVALVLGASAARGTGWAIAEALAAEGARVVVGARSLAPLEELARRIDGVAVRCDVASEADIEAAVRTAVERYGRLDIAVNAAGLPVMGPIAEATTDALQKAVEVNYFGNVYFIRHAAAAMRAEGSIVIISSASTTNVVEPHFAYACAKSATDCLVRYAAVEYGRRGIRVNSILPGPILSDMTWEYYSNPQVVERFEREIPLGRIGMPADFASAVVWLAGPTYLTGVNLQLNGGVHLMRFPRPDEIAMRPEDSGKPLFDRDGAGT
jgi:NAD(P)-dependent dehydrogenase (short-subunit alcohol dehydrogenase family)